MSEERKESEPFDFLRAIQLTDEAAGRDEEESSQLEERGTLLLKLRSAIDEGLSREDFVEKFNEYMGGDWRIGESETNTFDNMLLTSIEAGTVAPEVQKGYTTQLLGYVKEISEGLSAEQKLKVQEIVKLVTDPSASE